MNFMRQGPSASQWPRPKVWPYSWRTILKRRLRNAGSPRSPSRAVDTVATPSATVATPKT